VFRRLGQDSRRDGRLWRPGTKDAIDCLKSDPGIEMVALAEVLPDRLAGSLERMKKAAAGQVKVTPATSFAGFDAYRKVMALKEVDAVLLLTPPGFRPLTLRAAVEAGKHVFMEKPASIRWGPLGWSADWRTGRSSPSITQQRWQPHWELISAFQW
jgi:hypothetical protein